MVCTIESVLGSDPQKMMAAQAPCQCHTDPILNRYRDIGAGHSGDASFAHSVGVASNQITNYSGNEFFPTCQVRVVRFYVSCLLLPPPPPPPASCLLPPASCLVLLLLSSSSSLSSLSSLSSRPCSTATRDPQCSLPDLNHDRPRPVFPAGPQPRPATPSVPCRTSTTTSHAQCSLPDLICEYPCQVFPAGPQPRVSMPSVPCRTSCRKIWDKECAEES